MDGELYTGTDDNTFIVKYQVTGALTPASTLTKVWTRQFSSYTSGRSIIYDGVGGLYMTDYYSSCGQWYDFPNSMVSCGTSTSSYTRNLRKFDTNGNLIWTYQFNGVPFST